MKSSQQVTSKNGLSLALQVPINVMIPREIWNEIISYLPSSTIRIIRLLNKDFRKLVNIHFKVGEKQLYEALLDHSLTTTDKLLFDLEKFPLPIINYFQHPKALKNLKAAYLHAIDESMYVPSFDHLNFSTCMNIILYLTTTSQLDKSDTFCDPFFKARSGVPDDFLQNVQISNSLANYIQRVHDNTYAYCIKGLLNSLNTQLSARKNDKLLNFSNVSLSYKEIEQVSLSLKNINLKNCNFNGSKIEKFDCSHTDFRGSLFYKTVFEEVALDYTNFADSDLSGLTLSKVNLSYTNFTNANLRNLFTIGKLDWKRCILTGTNFFKDDDFVDNEKIHLALVALKTNLQIITLDEDSRNILLNKIVDNIIDKLTHSKKSKPEKIEMICSIKDKNPDLFPKNLSAKIIKFFTHVKIVTPRDRLDALIQSLRNLPKIENRISSNKAP